MPYETVASEVFEWNEYAIADMYNILETRMSRKGEPNEVDFTAIARTSKIFDEGLDAVVPNSDIAYQPDGIDVLDRTTVGLAELLMLAREKRVANTVFNAANYDAANVVTLSGSDQFSDVTSNPVSRIMTSLDIPLVRPNTMVFGQVAWTKTRTNPALVEAVRGAISSNAARNGVIAADELAALFQVQRVLVGQSRSNTANPGQTASFSRLWGNHIAMLHLNPLGAGQGFMPTWGWTARFGNRIVSSFDEPKIGLKGSIRQRVGECVREVVSAPGAGYYIINAVA
jgi:hypothetical protein